MSENKPWYYISYEHQYISKTTGNTQEWSRDEKITQQHPLEFLIHIRENYAENKYARYTYRLLFWSEIPETVALNCKDKIN